MSVDSGRNGGWIARWDLPRSEGERRRQRSRKFALKRDADIFDAEMTRRKALGPHLVEQLTKRDAVTLDQWIERRWAPEHGRTLAQATRDRYASSYKLHIYPLLGDESIGALGVARLRKWQAALLDAGASAETVIKARVMLSSVLTHAAGEGEIGGNLLSLVRPPKAVYRDAATPLSPMIVEQLCAVMTAPMTVKVPEGQRLGRRRVEYCMPDQRSPLVRARDALIVSVLAYGGLRPEELRALRWSDVGANTITVQRATNPDGSLKTTKNTKRRSVRLMAPVAQDLREYRLLAGRPPERTLIVPRPDGEPWTKHDWDNWRKRTWDKACCRAGLDAPIPYDLRHSAASLWIAEGHQPLRVAQWLGHSLKVLLDTYAHLIADFEDAGRINAEDEIARARGLYRHADRTIGATQQREAQ